MTLFALSSVRPNLDHEHGTIGILRRVGRRDSLLYGLLAIVATALALSACGEADNSGGTSASANAVIEPLPTRNPHAKAVEPVAGESAADAALPTAQPDDQPTPSGASAQLTKSARKRGNGPTDDAAISNAEVLKNGIALPPIEAPQAVHDIIEAGNQIARTPYLWGGGHGKWLDNGYDCSGSVSFALAGAGLLDSPLTSGLLARWGSAGRGRWITIYANGGHVFMEVAGLRFDTGGIRGSGTRWQATGRSTAGFVARHPEGL
jgi:cell wall-associated NlpC family hydrolase